MKKYLQIGAVVVLFGAFLLFRQFKSDDDRSVVGNNANTPQSVSNNSSQTDMPTPTTSATSGSGKTYKDGTYTGTVADAYYGNIQVQATISSGKITDVTFLQYPNDNTTSQVVNQQAMPLLKSEAIQSQSSQVDIVSGASQTSQAFQQSLSSALQQAM